MKALDLFCGAGGASRGLADAGFEVTGVDIEPQPNYPFRFIHADALETDTAGFDLVWASPPCQAFTAYNRRPDHVHPAENLIPRTRELLRASGIPYIIENVPGAPLEYPIQLCGSSFGLSVQRHRIFETSFPVDRLPCAHGWQLPLFPQATNRRNPRQTVEIGVWRIPLAVQRAAMGIGWMTVEELSQAVPPAYSRFLAAQFVIQQEPAHGLV